MPYYCATHKDEDLNGLLCERLDAFTAHMVIHKAYDLALLSAIGPQYVIWEMSKRGGYWYFHRIVERV